MKFKKAIGWAVAYVIATMILIAAAYFAVQFSEVMQRVG